MDLDPYVETLREQLVLAAGAGDDAVRDAADRLAAALGPAARMALLGALTDAAADLTAELAPTAVEVRLRGREPELVVVAPPAPAVPAQAPVAADEPVPAGDDAGVARVNLRLPADLKDRVDDAAKAAGVSANTWLVRAAAAALARPAAPPGTSAPAPQRGASFSGWAR